MNSGKKTNVSHVGVRRKVRVGVVCRPRGPFARRTGLRPTSKRTRGYARRRRLRDKKPQGGRNRPDFDE